MTNNTIALAVKWYNSAYKAIEEAGGYAPGVIDRMPLDLIETLVRNGIHLTYRNPILEK